MDITGLLIAAIASFLIGALWYAPFVFGRAWSRLAGVDMKMGAQTLIGGFVLELVRAYVVGLVVAAMGAYSPSTGIETGFWLWLGLVATVGLQRVLYERISLRLFAITFGYHLVALLAMGGILAVW